MIAIRFLALLLIVLAGSAAEAKAPRGAPAAGASERAILNRMKQQPLIFFVAKGSPNSCGANCNTWIAVEGSIDQEAAERPQPKSCMKDCATMWWKWASIPV